jgi:copper chaperone NosL
MSTRSRILTALAALLLVPVFFLPIWTIELEAPQYPEGIGMEIMVNTIRGQSEWDLQNINGLNHYIGMKEIHPESIRELDIMPWLLGGLVLFGLAAAATGRKRVLQAWLLTFLLLAIAGLVDFYLWGHDYGHNLNPDAAIKVPGMAYQPPLIGSKQLLNFTAHSWPGVGGMLAITALVLGAIALWVAARSRRAMTFALGAITMTASACAPGPEPIAYGQDVGEYCRMVIMDERYGAELVTRKGRIFKFDSIECLARYAGEMEDPAAVHSLWVTPFDEPGELIPVEQALILHSPALRSPMGANLTAFRASTTRPDSLLSAHGGQILHWDAVLELVAGTQIEPGRHEPARDPDE